LGRRDPLTPRLFLAALALPAAAHAQDLTVEVVGTTPLFGLNTLGGALSIETKSGRTAQGTSILGYYGAYDRASVQFPVQ
jgi:hypothetical protein